MSTKDRKVALLHPHLVTVHPAPAATPSVHLDLGGWPRVDVRPIRRSAWHGLVLLRVLAGSRVQLQTVFSVPTMGCDLLTLSLAVFKKELLFWRRNY